MLWKWWGGAGNRDTRPSRKKKRRPATRRRLWLEVLEDRIAPATVTWTNLAGGDWSKVGNWSTGALPGSSDDFVIPTPNSGVFVTHSQNVADTAKSLTASAPFTLSGGTLTVTANTNTGNFSDGSAVRLAGGTLANANIAAGTNVTATGKSTLTRVMLAGTLSINRPNGGTPSNDDGQPGPFVRKEYGESTEPN